MGHGAVIVALFVGMASPGPAGPSTPRTSPPGRWLAITGWSAAGIGGASLAGFFFARAYRERAGEMAARVERSVGPTGFSTRRYAEVLALRATQDRAQVAVATTASLATAAIAAGIILLSIRHLRRRTHAQAVLRSGVLAWRGRF